MANSIDGVEGVGGTQLYIGGFGTYDGATKPPRDMVAVMPVQLPYFEEGEKQIDFDPVFSTSENPAKLSDINLEANGNESGSIMNRVFLCPKSC